MASRSARRAVPSRAPFDEPTRSRLTRAVQAALFAGSLTTMAAVPQWAIAQTAASTPRNFQVPAGPLAGALAGFAADAGVSVSAPPELVRGIASPGLSGSFPVAEGLARVLAGTGLEAVPGGDRAWVLRRRAAAATTEASGTTLAAVTVTAQAERNAATEGTGAYNARTVTIGKSDRTLREVPQSVSVVTRQRLDDQNLYTLDEALEATTGITTFQSPSGGKYYYARGFQFSTFQYDGVPLERSSYAIGSGFTSDTSYYDRIEVLRGPAGLMQGAGSPGGTLNLVRKRPQAEKTLSISTSAGSWDNYRTSVDAGGPLNEDGSLRGRASFTREDRHYFYDTAKSRKDVFYGILEYDISPATTIAAGVSSEDLDALPYWGGLPRNADGSAVDVRRSTFTGASWNRWTNRQTTLFADATHRFNDRWTLKAAAMVLKENNDMLYSFGRGAVDPLTGDGMVSRAYLYDFENTNKGIDVHLDGKFDAAGRTHEIVIGANASRLHTDDLAAGLINLGGMNIYDPVSPRQPTLSELMNTSYTAYSQRTVNQTGVYGVARLKLADPLTLVLGGRVSNYSYEVESQKYVSGVQSSTRMDAKHEFTPYGGLIYELNKQWSAYASYADIFEPQSALNASGSLLKPIQGSNVEVGLKGEHFGGKLNTSFALFRINQTNRAQVDYLSDMNCDGWYCSVASGQVRSQGFDAEVSGEVARGLQVFAGYTYTSTQYRKNEEDETQVGLAFNSYTPRHLLRLAADYRLPGALNAWSVGGGVTVQSDNHHTNYGGTGGVARISQPGYAVWNARIGYRIDPRWSVGLNINNLLDKRYYSTIGWLYADSHFGEPRNAMVTLRGTF
ncbi:MAG: TonB-dependent siderophore receptor [Pseudomonadota bacterium]